MSIVLNDESVVNQHVSVGSWPIKYVNLFLIIEQKKSKAVGFDIMKIQLAFIYIFTSSPGFISVLAKHLARLVASS